MKTPMFINTLLWRTFKIVNCKICGKHFSSRKKTNDHLKQHEEYNQQTNYHGD